MLLVLAALLAGLVTKAVGAEIRIVLSDDSSPYEKAFQTMKSRLEGRGHNVTRLLAERVDGAAFGDPGLVVTIGIRATESLLPFAAQQAVLAILVPRDWYHRSGHPALLRAGARTASAIFVDQPFERQARLIRLAFPEASRVGLLTGDKPPIPVKQLEAELRRQGLALVHETASSQRDLIQALESVLAASDLLLALPDPVAFSRSTAQSIFLTSYRYRDPVLGYSQSLTRAGALLSLHSNPEQVARQAADWIERAWLPTSTLPDPASPSSFSITVNEQVARSLGISLPSAATLLDKMGGEP